MVKHIADICEANSDIIVNAANAQGWMGGFLGKWFKMKGVAESLHYITKGKIEREAKKEAKRLSVVPGDVFITTSVDPLSAQYIFHAVTMDKPGQRSTLEIVNECVSNIIILAYRYNLKSITIPLLGCGTGCLNESDVMKIYKDRFRSLNLSVVIANNLGDVSILTSQINDLQNDYKCSVPRIKELQYYNEFDVAASIEAQNEFCKTNSVPHFAPSKGICYSCQNNIYQQHGTRNGISLGKAMYEHITGCPHCLRSYLD